MKSYTDIKQSYKLAKILPLESADMYYFRQFDDDYFPPDVESIYLIPLYKDSKEDFNYDIPCWSLAALLKLIPNFNMFKRTIECRIETTGHLIDKACDLVDAAFEMVCWLKENNKL